MWGWIEQRFSAGIEWIMEKVRWVQGVWSRISDLFGGDDDEKQSKAKEIAALPPDSEQKSKAIKAFSYQPPTVKQAIAANDNSVVAKSTTSPAAWDSSNSAAVSGNNALAINPALGQQQTPPPQHKTINQTVTVTIQAAPGEDARDIARQVAQILQTQSTGALHDG